MDPGWSAPLGPNGGYLAALLVRALQAHLAPSGERQLRSLTVHYLRRAADGEIEISIEPLRVGRRITSARLSASQHGREVLTGLTAFSVRDLPVAGLWAPTAPEVAPAPRREAGFIAAQHHLAGDADGWLESADETPPIIGRVQLAPRLGGIPFSGRTVEPGGVPEAGGWITLPEPRPVDAPLLALCADVWWPPALEPLSRPAGAPTIDLTLHVRADLPPEGFPDQPVLGCFRSSAAIAGLMDEDGAIFLADGTLAAQSRQLALLAPLG